MNKIISSFSLKGGVGKTTFITNLGVYLASQNKKVCILDLDAQSNVANSFGLNGKNIKYTVYEILTEDINLNLAINPILPNLSIIASDSKIYKLELNNKDDKELILKVEALIKNLKKKYDYVLFDFAPGMSFLSSIFLKETDYVFSLFELDFYNFTALVNTLDVLNSGLIANLKKSFFIANKFSKNSKNNLIVYDEYKTYIKDLNNSKIEFLDFPLRKSIQAANSVLNQRMPLWNSKIRCTLKNDYSELFKLIKL